MLAGAAFVWRNDILRTALDPRTPYQVYRPPPAPDYARRQAWALLPDRPERWTFSGPQADVFFVHPTTYDGGREWNAPVDDAEAGERLDEVMLPNYAGPYAEIGRVFAPRYRQASLYSLLTLRDDARDARRFAYDDVRRAFHTYLQRWNGGRPLLIVGVEQGGSLAARLLRDEIAVDPALRSRLVGTHLIETVQPVDGVGPPACAGRDQARCALSFAAVREADTEAARRRLDRALVWGAGGQLENLNGRPALCVNPVSGSRTEAEAPARAHLGAANATGLEWGARPGFMPRQVSARCQGGLLYVSRPESPSLQPRGGLGGAAPRAWLQPVLRRPGGGRPGPAAGLEPAGGLGAARALAGRGGAGRISPYSPDRLKGARVKRAVLMTLTLLAAAPAAADPISPERARAILRTTPLIDGHNDLPWALRERKATDLRTVDIGRDQSRLTPPLHTDLPRLKAGGVGAQFWSVYVPADLPPNEQLAAVLEQIDLVKRMTAQHPEALAAAWSADDVRKVHRSGRTASLIGMEGGAAIGGSLGVLRELRRAGVRYVTLTHSKTTNWADSATDAPRHGGLSPFGEEVVREMNRQGVLVDLSHVSEAAMDDALRVAQAPVIFSHSSARAVTDHPRNVPDAVLSRLKGNGGVVMVTFVPGFVNGTVRRWSAAETAEKARLAALHPGDQARAGRELEAWRIANPAPRARLTDVADHLDHVRRVAGVDHVGLGSDFDGIETTVEGLDSADDYPALLAELSRRGWSEQDLRKLAGENLLRVMEQADRAAQRLQARP